MTCCIAVPSRTVLCSGRLGFVFGRKQKQRRAHAPTSARNLLPCKAPRMISISDKRLGTRCISSPIPAPLFSASPLDGAFPASSLLCLTKGKGEAAAEKGTSRVSVSTVLELHWHRQSRVRRVHHGDWRGATCWNRSPPVGPTDNWAFDSRSDRERPA